MQQEKKSDLPEEFPEAKNGEVGDVTITEYRKNQMVRLAECFIVSPLCIYSGIRYRKELPTWLSTSLVIFGAATLIYNGRNFVVNHNRDGKLIRQAIKQKKEEEKKIRDKIIKADNTASQPAENKHESPPPVPKPAVVANANMQTKLPIMTTEKKEVQMTVTYNQDKSIATPAKVNHETGIIEITKNIKQSEINPKMVDVSVATPKRENNSTNIILSDAKEIESKLVAVNISVADKKENVEMVSDKKKEVEASVDNPTLSIEKSVKENTNGREAKVVG